MTILICWHFLAFVLRAKFNTDEFWHTLKPARVPDQLSGEAHPPARVWSDGSQMEELQGAAEWSGEWLSGERSCLCSLIPFPVHGPAQQRHLGFCLDCHAPDSSGHTWSSAALCGCTMVPPSAIRLALVYLLIWSLWVLYSFKWFLKLWAVGSLQEKKPKTFSLSLVEFYML